MELHYSGHKRAPSRHNEKVILFDARYQPGAGPQPVIIFIHGFKGFKDWGPFNLMAAYWAQQGFVSVKLNLSHNGTTPEQPTDFADLEAFSKNNFSIELDDIGTLIDHLHSPESQVPAAVMNLQQLYLVGHSRGGGLAMLKAAEDPRVKALATWAAIADIDKRWAPEVLAQWKKEGTLLVPNSRTGQDMPLDYQLVQDYKANHARLNIPQAVKKLTVPHLVVHGTNDEAVPHEMALDLNAWSQHSTLHSLPEQNHTFGARHPYTGTELQGAFKDVVQLTSNYFKNLA